MPTVVESLVDGAVARRLRGFGPLGLTVFVVIALVGPVLGGSLTGGLLVLLWVSASHTPWHAIGYVRPANWIRTVIGGLAFGILFKLVMKILVMPFLGAPPINSAYHYLVGNVPAVAAMAIYLIVAAGFGEETLYRGFLFERLEKLLGSLVGMKVLIVLITSAWFAALHYPDQGVPGVEQAAVTGIVFGTIFARTGRIWLPMVAHAAFDLTALAIIYWNLESPMAHLVFK
jgi:hypothetical protein